MPAEPDDAWMQIPPLDRYADVLGAGAPAGPSSWEPYAPGMLSFSLALKGTEARFFVSGGLEEPFETRFKYKRGACAWQMFHREDGRWIPDGPPSARTGRLLERVVRIMQGEDPRNAFDYLLDRTLPPSEV